MCNWFCCLQHNALAHASRNRIARLLCVFLVLALGTKYHTLCSIDRTIVQIVRAQIVEPLGARACLKLCACVSLSLLYGVRNWLTGGWCWPGQLNAGRSLQSYSLGGWHTRALCGAVRQQLSKMRARKRPFAAPRRARACRVCMCV